MNERRVARRYDVAVPVRVGQAGLRHHDRPRGLTRDISTSGLYFTMEQPPRPGSRVELTLTLPGSLTGSGDVLIELVGRVVRVDTGVDSALNGGGGEKSTAGSVARTAAASTVGVAAHIEKYDIISARPSSQSPAQAV